MSDGFNFQPRAKEPESALIPGMAAVPSVAEQAARFIAMPNGIPDTSMSGPVMLQTPPRWSHDFDPETGDSRARLPAVIPIIDYPPATPTPPEGSSDQTVATTEFVDRACAAAVRRAVAEARLGVDGRYPAGPGEIGEIVEINIPGPGSELTAGQMFPLTNLVLSSGDWLLTATLAFNITGLITPPLPTIHFVGAFSETTSFPGFARGVSSLAMTPTGADLCFPIFQRVLTPADRQMFLLAYAQNFAPGRVFAYGYVSATRLR